MAIFSVAMLLDLLMLTQLSIAFDVIVVVVVRRHRLIAVVYRFSALLDKVFEVIEDTDKIVINGHVPASTGMAFAASLLGMIDHTLLFSSIIAGEWEGHHSNPFAIASEVHPRRVYDLSEGRRAR